MDSWPTEGDDSGSNTNLNEYNVGFDVGWELDFWGRFQRGIESADAAFLDADKSGYADYLKKLQPKVRPGGLIIAHNMRSPAPDPDFIKLITSDVDLDVVFLNMVQSGIGVALKKR